MLYKPGVDFVGVQAPIWYAVGVFEVLYNKRGCKLVVTSCVDGVHSSATLHKSGNAVDMRIHDVPQSTLDLIIADARLILFPLGYDVVKEVDHIHCEYDPKEGRDNWQLQSEA